MGSKSSKNSSDHSQQASDANHHNQRSSPPSSSNSLYSSSIPPQSMRNQPNGTAYDETQQPNQPYGRQATPYGRQTQPYGRQQTPNGRQSQQSFGRPASTDQGFSNQGNSHGYGTQNNQSRGNGEIQEIGHHYTQPQTPNQSERVDIQTEEHHSPDHDRDMDRQQQQQNSKNSKKSKKGKASPTKLVHKDSIKTSSTGANEQSLQQLVPGPVTQVGTNSAPSPAPVSGQLMQIPRAVFDREEFIREQKNKKQSVTSGDWLHSDNPDSRESHYNQGKEAPSKSGGPSELRRRQSELSSYSQRVQSGRTSPSSRAESDALPMSDAETRSLNSLAQDQDVVGFVQVLPEEPFHGWGNLHHAGINHKKNPVKTDWSSENSRSVGLPDRDY